MPKITNDLAKQQAVTSAEIAAREIERQQLIDRHAAIEAEVNSIAEEFANERDPTKLPVVWRMCRRGSKP